VLERETSKWVKEENWKKPWCEFTIWPTIHIAFWVYFQSLFVSNVQISLLNIPHKSEEYNRKRNRILWYFIIFWGFLSIIFEWNLREIVKSCERADEKRGRKRKLILRNRNSELFEGFERFSRHIHLRVEQHTIVDEVFFRAALAPELREFSLLCDDLVSLPLHLRCAMIAERQTL